VGIPTYNRPEGLRRTLECIINQTYTNLEIIVSDNNSNSPEVIDILNEFKNIDSRIVFFIQPENKGAVFNFLFVLGLSSGKYYLWAADDDAWMPDYIEECVSVMEANPEVTICYSEAVLENYNGQERMIWASDMSTTDMSKLAGVRKVLLNQHRNTEFYGLLRTKLIKKYKFTGYFGEDHSVVLYMAMQGQISKISPGLFISGHGETLGSSPQSQAAGLGVPLSRYFGYIKLHLEMIRLTLQPGNGLSWLQKPVVAMYILERIFFVPLYRDAINAGITDFLHNYKYYVEQKKRSKSR
jgi:glycosyltransferase involved in cell wall biosynthesis